MRENRTSGTVRGAPGNGRPYREMDANRQFSSILCEVGQGEAFTVLWRGKPVATIAPLRSVGQSSTRPCEAQSARSPAPAGAEWRPRLDGGRALRPLTMRVALAPNILA